MPEQKVPNGSLHGTFKLGVGRTMEPVYDEYTQKYYTGAPEDQRFHR